MFVCWEYIEEFKCSRIMKKRMAENDDIADVIEKIYCMVEFMCGANENVDMCNVFQ